MSEETRAAYWKRIEELNAQIEALEDERDSIVLSDEDKAYYRERQLGLFSKITSVMLRSNHFLKTNAFLDSLSGGNIKIDAALKISLPTES